MKLMKEDKGKKQGRIFIFKIIAENPVFSKSFFFL